METTPAFCNCKSLDAPAWAALLCIAMCIAQTSGRHERTARYFRVARDPTGIVRILSQSFRLSEVRRSGGTEHRPLFRSRSLVLGCERGNPCSRCHSKSLPEKCDEGARLAIADVGCNRLYRTPCNQQLYPFHQTHLPSPKLEARPNFSAESSLNCPDAHTDFSTQCIQ